MTVQTVWSGWERTGVLQTDVTTRGEIQTFVGGKTWQIHPLAQSTVTGSMASLDMKHLALDTGPVGMAQPQNNFV